MSAITVEQLQAKVDEWHAKRSEIDVLKDAKEILDKELYKIQAELLQFMEELSIKKFEGTMGGKVQLVETEYVNMPEDDVKKEEFFNYLKETGEFEGMATVHYQKLNSWHKAKREELGEFFMCPGLELPKTRKEIRKGR